MRVRAHERREQREAMNRKRAPRSVMAEDVRASGAGVRFRRSGMAELFAAHPFRVHSC
jgi:hypothetical protein